MLWILILQQTGGDAELREELLAVEEDRVHGSRGYSVDEVASMMREAIKEASGHGETK